MHEFPLHHIGVATHGIDREFPVFEALGYRKVSEIFSDPVQKIRGLFITAPGQPPLELLENLYEHGPLDVPLERGIKLYHFAYAVDNLEQALEKLLRLERAKIVSPVTPASMFKRVCFVMLPNMMLVELLELSGESPLGAVSDNVFGVETVTAEQIP